MSSLIENLTPESLAAMIDHTFLKAFGTAQDVEKLCTEACRYRFATVMVNPAEIERCVQLLAGTGISIGATIGFPLGQNCTPVKEFEAQDAIARGARELDMVINIRALQDGRADVVRLEMQMLAAVCREHGCVSKVILETCYLTDSRKRLACELAREAGVDFVKTSTGFGAGGATVGDVRLLRAAVGPSMGVKASGGIRDLSTAIAMIEAGANRLGTSGSVSIVEELRRRKEASG